MLTKFPKKIFKFFKTERKYTNYDTEISSKICIIGCNANSLYLAALMLKSTNLSPSDITVIGNDFLSDFYFKFKYIPGFMSYGDNFQLRNSNLYPKEIIKEEVAIEKIFLEENRILCENGIYHKYENLIITPFLYRNFDYIESE